MRKFIFSSKAQEFKGSFNCVYNEDDVLQVLNFADSDLLPPKRQWIKKNLPEVLDVERLKQFVKDTRTEAVESTISYSFEDFWTKYNKKINKKRCIPLWNKLSPARQVSAVGGIQKYEQYLKVQSWRSKADPENYLRNEMWENEWK